MHLPGVCEDPIPESSNWNLVARAIYLYVESVLVTLGIDDDAELAVNQIVGVVGEDRAYLAIR